MPTERLSFVSVVFEPEVGLQVVQGRSFGRHLDPGVVEDVIVVDNTARGLTPQDRSRVVSSYGDLASRVRIERLRETETMRGRHGWRRQQVAKLSTARLVSTRRYVALDAKNHLIRATGLADFVAADGRSRAGMHSYATHPLRNHLVQTLRYLGADEPRIAALSHRFPTTATPFVFDRDTVSAMIDDLTPRGGSFEDEFERSGALEFFLYSGWVTLRGPGFDAVAVDHPIQSPVVWPRHGDAAGIRAARDAALAVDAPFFGVHRRVFARADGASLRAIGEMWADRRLVDTVDAGVAAARRTRGEVRRGMLLTQARARIGRLVRPARGDDRDRGRSAE